MKVLLESHKLWHIGKLSADYGPPDFYVRRVGSQSTVGEVHDEPTSKTSHYPVYIMDHRIDGRFAKYAAMHAHQSGHYRGLAKGTTNLVNITKDHIHKALQKVILRKQEAVDPEDRAVRLAKIRAYAKRNKAAMDMAPSSNPHAQVHYHARYQQAAQILRMKRVDAMTKHPVYGRSGSQSRVIGLPARIARRDLRKAQAKALKIAKGSPLMKHAAVNLTQTAAWKAFRRSKGYKS